MSTIKHFTPWQIEMAVTASFCQLDLWYEKRMVAYANFLLDKGLYDDALLAMLDDDPLYPNPQSDKKKHFKIALSNLGFPTVTETQAKWIYTYFNLSIYATRPHNHQLFSLNSNNIYLYFDDFYNSNILQDIGNIEHLLYQLDDGLFQSSWGEVYQGYNDSATLFELQTQFFELCEICLIKHQNKIDNIFAKLYS